MAKTKNSLVDNINRRKKAGISRTKANSHVSKAAWDEMKAGWPKSEKTKQTTAKTTAKAKTKSAAKAKTKSAARAQAAGGVRKAKTKSGAKASRTRS